MELGSPLAERIAWEGGVSEKVFWVTQPFFLSHSARASPKGFSGGWVASCALSFLLPNVFGVWKWETEASR